MIMIKLCKENDSTKMSLISICTYSGRIFLRMSFKTFEGWSYNVGSTVCAVYYLRGSAGPMFDLGCWSYCWLSTFPCGKLGDNNWILLSFDELKYSILISNKKLKNQKGQIFRYFRKVTISKRWIQKSRQEWSCFRKLFF